jgi:hypothetical protein
MIDPRFGFFPPSSQPPPSAPDTSDTETSPDEGEDNNDDKEVDEISDSEDERRAHELLQATPTRARTTGGSSPILLPYDNHNFAVRFIVCNVSIPLLLAYKLCRN